MKIVSWNINGVKARLDGLLTYLREHSPDVLCLQEIKSIDENFPRLEIEDAGYNVAVHGQKSFNGVAILSRFPIDDVAAGLPGDDSDTQARYLEATVGGGDAVVRVASLYLPNGNPLWGEKFDYKLAWMKRLEAHARSLLGLEMPVVLAGDYNVIPGAFDAKTPGNWVNDALFQPQSRQAFQRLTYLGFTDAVRACRPDDACFSFWDYQAGAWQKDNGIRIDHLLLSPQAADLCASAGVDRFTRGWEKPSDHAPAWVELAPAAA